MLAMRRISLERRRGNLGDVETFFKKYIEDAASPEIASFYSIKYARFLLKVIFLYILLLLLYICFDFSSHCICKT